MIVNSYLEKLTVLLVGSLIFLSCQHNHNLRIAKEVEEPNNSILNTLIPLLEKSSDENIKVEIVDHSYASMDSLKNGSVDLFITDNNGTYNEQLTAVAPLFPEILHILHKKNYNPQSLFELLSGKKIYAGEKGSAEYLLCKEIITDFNINNDSVEFLETRDLFKSDVIMLFTDLVSLSDIRDLKDYQFYSLDDPELLGAGTIAEAISLRNPGLSPFIIPKSTYAGFTPKAILTLMSESILICRADMDEHIVYEISRLITEKKQLFYNISPMIQLGYKQDFENTSAVYPLHKGTINFLDRNKPSFLHRHAELLGVILSLFIAVISGTYTLRNYRNIRKKDNIDIYYAKLEEIRIQIPDSNNRQQIINWQNEIRGLESETINLLINEKLNANESYIVYMNMMKQIKKELEQTLDKLP